MSHCLSGNTLAAACLGGVLGAGTVALGVPWDVKIANEAPGQLHRDEALTFEVTCTSPEPVAEVTLRVVSERLIRGDTIYEGPVGGPYKIRQPNYETRPALNIEERLTLTAVPQAENTYRAEFRVPLTLHEYGLCYVTTSLLNESGKELVKKELGYSVLVKLPKDQPGNIAGFDNWGAPGNYGHMPDRNYANRFLTDHGLRWVNLKVWWNYLRTGPGEYQENYLKCIDAWVDAAVRQQAKIIMNPVFLPEGVDNPNDPNAALREYAHFTESLMKRYGDRLTAWDVFNEADCQSWIQKGNRDVDMIRVSRELRDRHCPHVKIVISGQSTTTHNWARHLMEFGAGRDLDGLAWHPYRNLGPEGLEADNDIGNKEGTATFLRAAEDLHNILKKGGVSGELHLNEWNYALNLQPQLDDNDNANFMTRATILSYTTDYIANLCVHAFGNGRLHPPAFPNLAWHLMDTEYIGQCAVGDPDAYAFAFRKSDGRVIVPAWTSTTAKTVRLTGLVGEPEVRDLYGNRINVSYDAADKALDLLKVAQEPVYVTAPKGSVPKLKISDVVKIDVPAIVRTGTTVSVTVAVGSLSGPRAALAVQVPEKWRVSPATVDLSGSRTHTFKVTVPADAEPKGYPILADLRDSAGTSVALVGEMTAVRLATSTYRKQYGIVFASDFARSGPTAWQVQKSAQGEVKVVTRDGRPALLFAKAGFDFPLVIEHAIEPTTYGAFEFECQIVNDGQEFRATAGSVRLLFDPKGVIRLGNTKIGSYTVGRWQKMRLFFSVPDGWCRVWQGRELLGQFPTPVGEDVSSLRFLSKQSRAGRGTDALLRAVRLTRIVPQQYESCQTLRWSICGPFPNRIDPETGKRPFEIDKDWLAPIGGKAGAIPYPGLEVPDGQGNTRRFLPFVGVNKADNHLCDFMTIEELLPPDGRGNVTCYAVAYIVSDRDRDLGVGIGSDDSYALWINNELHSRVNAWPLGRGTRGASVPGAPAKLRKGLNVVLIEVDQGDGAFRFAVVFGEMPKE